MKNKENPTYLNWLLTEHKRGKVKLALMIYGIIQAIYATPLVYNEWYYGHMPILPLIASYIAIYGFVIGIALQPFLIYKKLVKLDWWNRFGN